MFLGKDSALLMEGLGLEGAFNHARGWMEDHMLRWLIMFVLNSQSLDWMSQDLLIHTPFSQSMNLYSWQWQQFLHFRIIRSTWTSNRVPSIQVSTLISAEKNCTHPLIAWKPVLSHPRLVPLQYQSKDEDWRTGLDWWIKLVPFRLRSAPSLAAAISHVKKAVWSLENTYQSQNTRKGRRYQTGAKPSFEFTLNKSWKGRLRLKLRQDNLFQYDCIAP